MKYGKIICDPTSEEAKALIGKKVVASDYYLGLKDEEMDFCEIGVLASINEDDGCPFIFGNDFCKTFTFIRERIEEPKKYVPYDLSKKEVRDKLRGRWYRHKSVEHERMVDDFCYYKENGWFIVGYNASDFLKNCIWIDGTTCGEEEEE